MSDNRRLTVPPKPSSPGHTHDGTGGNTSVVVGGTNESGANVPTATTVRAIAIGDFANAGTDLGPIAIGSGDAAASAPNSTGEGSIAIGGAAAGGAGARAEGDFAIAIGSGASFGSGAIASPGGTTDSDIAIGFGSIASGGSSIAFGIDSDATALDSIAIGHNTAVVNNGGIALGLNASGASTRGIAIGSFARVTISNECIAIGGGINTTCAPLASGTGAIAIGSNSTAANDGARSFGAQSISIGSGTSGAPGASSTAPQSIAIGRAAAASATSSIAIGSGASATHTDSVAIGIGATTFATNQIRLGTIAESVSIPGFTKAGKQIYPATDNLTSQTACGLLAGSGAPNNANGNNGDFYFRSDGGASTRIYHKAAGVWTGIV